MPILKHAKKKLKQDKKRTIKNKKIKETYKLLVKKAKEKNSPASISKAFQAVDKAAKKNVLSKNKAAHLKSSLNKKSDSEKPAAPVAKKATKPAAKKASKSTGAKTKPASKK